MGEVWGVFRVIVWSEVLDRYVVFIPLVGVVMSIDLPLHAGSLALLIAEKRTEHFHNLPNS